MTHTQNQRITIGMTFYIAYSTVLSEKNSAAFIYISDRHVGPVYCLAEMYAGRVACYPW